jgi:hypothetical protein
MPHSKKLPERKNNLRSLTKSRVEISYRSNNQTSYHPGLVEDEDPNIGIFLHYQYVMDEKPYTFL